NVYPQACKTTRCAHVRLAVKMCRARGSDYNCFFVLPENAAQRIGYFPDGRTRFHCLKDARHEIRAGSRSFFYGDERSLPWFSIAAHGQCADALHLVALYSLVNALDRNRLLFFYCKTVHANNGRFAPLRGLLVLVGSALDFLLHIAALERTDHSAKSL